MESIYTNIEHCRVCEQGTLVDVMDFGEQFLASAFVDSNDDHPLSKVKVPLTISLCETCGHCQLKETVRRDILFHDYFYRSGTNPMMQATLKDVVEDLLQRVQMSKGDTILDIGCNDGTLLSYLSPEYQRVGVEPATNIDWSHLHDSITIINDFFAQDKVLEATQGGLCQAITSIAMMYSVEFVNCFTEGIKSLLAADGVWCLQVSYLPAIIESVSFYDVCHEHLNYFSLDSLSFLMQRHGLKILDVSLSDVNGGSLRVFVSHLDNQRQPTEAVAQLLESEKELRLTDVDMYHQWFKQVNDLKEKVTCYLQDAAASGFPVMGLGASTKGNVLLQYFQIDKKLLPYISERNPDKVGLKTLGTDIDLISEQRARELKPSCMLVLIWFFKAEIIKREQAYLDQGGKLLFPMPYCHVVTKDGEQRL